MVEKNEGKQPKEEQEDDKPGKTWYTNPLLHPDEYEPWSFLNKRKDRQEQSTDEGDLPAEE
jgi:hypothetical protein